MADVAKKFFEERAATPDKSAEESEVRESDTTEPEEPKSEVKEEAPETEETPKGPIPYERFAEVNSAKVELETKVKEWEPVVQAQNSIVEFCSQKQITPEAFREALELAAMVRENPAQARKRLLEVAGQLADFDDSVVPNDLQSRVTEGEISEAAAKEIARLRAMTRTGQVSQQQTAEQLRRQEANSVASAVAAWDSSKRNSDPSYRPGGNGKLGLHEVTQRNFAFLVSTQSPKSAQDVVRLLEQAYSEAKQVFSTSKPATRPSLSSTRSSTNNKSAPKTLQDVARITLAKHGIDWRPQAVES